MSNPDISPIFLEWRDRQSAEVRADIEHLQRSPDLKGIPDFLMHVACIGVDIAEPRLLQRLQTFWESVPSKLAFRLAVYYYQTAWDLRAFLSLVEQALPHPAAVDEFALVVCSDDPIDEILSWLRTQAHTRTAAAILESAA